MLTTFTVATTVRSGLLMPKAARRLRDAWDTLPDSDPRKRVEEIAGLLVEGIFFGDAAIGNEVALWCMLDRTCNPNRYSHGTMETERARALLDELRELTVDPWPVAEPWWFSYDLPASYLDRDGDRVGHTLPAHEFAALHGPWKGR